MSSAANGILAIVTDTRSRAQVPAAEIAERDDVLEAAKELGVTGRIWKRRAPPSPTAKTSGGRLTWLSNILAD